jgi:predicted O-methyltransferase YrrM
VVRGRLQQLRQRRALDEYRLLRRFARRLGYHLVPANYYSPIPDLPALADQVFEQPSPMPGVAWDIDSQLQFVSEQLGPFLPELAAPLDPPGLPDNGYHYRNEFFNALDADVLYAVVRWLRPSRIVEVGSGYSTLVIEAALRRSALDGGPGQGRLIHEVYDPHPSAVLGPVLDRLTLRPTAAEEIDLGVFSSLQAGDLLFIDTTHAVRPGGDVVRLLLEVVPQLAPGVVVQIHDVFRPYEYPRELGERFGAYWQEHHLVQALLAFNTEFQILCANHALFRQRRTEVQALVPALEEGMLPSSLWLRRD